MFYAIDIEDRISQSHPLRPIKRLVDEILQELSPLFSKAYSNLGRPSVPPEVLLKALLLQALYSIRSERQLVERLDTDLLFRWFCGLDPAEKIFNATDFTHNRPRLDAHGITGAFFNAVVQRAVNAGLTSNDHFSVDGTLIESCASIKSFKRIDQDNNKHDDKSDDDQDNNSFKSRNAEADFKGKKLSNTTHRSTTDPDAKYYRKARGHEAKLCHMGHAISENRNGLIMAACVSEASGTAECEASLAMLDHIKKSLEIQPRTLGADRGYDSGPWMLAVENQKVTPHAAMRKGPVGGTKNTSSRRKKNRAFIAARKRNKSRVGQACYRASQRFRKKVEEVFGWCKTVGGLARARHVERWKIGQQFELAAAAYNLVRLRNLLGS